MSLLFRVMARNNALILLPALLVGTGIYVLTDLFERLDNFIDAGLGWGMVLTYFIYKIPLIISQILPVVFLLATVIQLCLMIRSREMIALHAGGVSPLTILNTLVLCGLFWGGVQLGFSQWIGVEGELEANRIWQEQVRKRTLSRAVLHNIWFTEDNWIVSLDTVNPDDDGTGLHAYRLSEDRLRVEEVLTAARFHAQPRTWTLYEVTRTLPESFSHTLLPEHTMPLRQRIDSFRIVQPGTNPQQLSVLQLASAIDALRASGSNVELLRTAWHSKLAYAAAIAVMTFVAMAIATWKDNIYIATGLALMVTFFYYAVYTFTTTLGQQGLMYPVAAAWCANGLVFVGSMAKLMPVIWQHDK